MTPERIEELQNIYASVTELAPAEQAEHVAMLCEGDEELRAQVERLLGLRERARKLLARPLPEQLLGVGSAAGLRVGPWQTVREIGRGGMGAVYLAERADKSFQKQVAVKTFAAALGGTELVRRFRQERQILAYFEHPNIARLLDAGSTDEGIDYLVMEYVEGIPITEYANKNDLSIPERLHLFQRVCKAVHYAHRNRVVHRDLKPGNILVTPEGEIKLLDFGIAKLLDPRALDAESAPTIPLMTPEYASPEQVEGKSISIATDIYSLGVVLYELLTGERPYRIASRRPIEIARAVIEQEPERPSQRVGKRRTPFAGEKPERLKRTLSGDLDKIVLKALRKKTDDRYESVQQFSDDISRYESNEPIVAHEGGVIYRSVKSLRRHWWLYILVAGALLASVFFADRADEAAEEARRQQRNVYEADMRQAGEYLREGDYESLRTRLNAYLDPQKQTLRGFEWYYLRKQAFPEKFALKYSAQVNVVAYSPDGTILAAGCEDGVVRLWDAINGAELRTITASTSPILALGFAPDGKSFATGEMNHTVRVWDTASGRERWNWSETLGRVYCVRFSRDGTSLLISAENQVVLLDVVTHSIRHTFVHENIPITTIAPFSGEQRLVSAGESPTIYFWDLASGRQMPSLEQAHAGKFIFSLSVSPDGKILASGGGDKTTALWDLATHRLIRRLEGHANAVRGVSFSPDGRFLATASSDRTIKLWRVDTGEEIEAFRSHAARIRSIAFSPDGRSIASSSDEGEVKIWDIAENPKPPNVLTGHTERVFSLAFAPDSTRLASAGTDKTARIWDLQTGRSLAELRGHNGEIYSIAFDPIRQHLATASMDSNVRIWSADGTFQDYLAMPYGSPMITFAPDGRAVAAYRFEDRIRLIDVETGRTLGTFLHPKSRVVLWYLTHKSREMLAGFEDGTLIKWDLATGREVFRFHFMPRSVPFARLSDNDRELTIANDETVSVWDLATHQKLSSIGNKSNPLYVYDISPNGDLMLTKGAQRMLAVRERATGRLRFNLDCPSKDGRRARFSPDGRSIAAVCDDRIIKTWETNSGRHLADLKGHKGHIHSLAFSPDGKRLASAGTDRTVRFWDLQSIREINAFTGHLSDAMTVRFSDDGSKLLSAGYDSAALLWDTTSFRQTASIELGSSLVGSITGVACGKKWIATSNDLGLITLYDSVTGEIVRVFKGHHPAAIWNIRFSPDEKLLASASWDGTVRLWDLATGGELFRFTDRNKEITGIAFSPDGSRLATASHARTVKLWDVATGREVATLSGHTDQVLSVAFSPDGRRLASGSTDQTVRLWDVETKHEVLTLRGHTDEVWSVAFSPDGKTLASASWDKTIRLWRTN